MHRLRVAVRDVVAVVICPCGGETKPLRRVGPTPDSHWHVDQCKACGREHRRLVEKAETTEHPRLA